MVSPDENHPVLRIGRGYASPDRLSPQRKSTTTNNIGANGQHHTHIDHLLGGG
jgi:hypothetical protein